MNTPTVKEELDRKVLETLDSLDKKLNANMITQFEMIQALETINSVALGLMDNDIALCISEYLADHKNEQRQDQVEIFKTRLHNLVVVRHDVTNAQVTLVKVPTEWGKADIKTITFDEAMSPDQESMAHYRKTVAKVKSDTSFKPLFNCHPFVKED